MRRWPSPRQRRQLLPCGVARRSSPCAASAPVLDQLLVTDEPLALRRDPNHEGPRGHVARDHGTGCDERLLADLDAREDARATADATGTSQDRAGQRGPLRMPAHRVVVVGEDARPYEHVVLHDRERRDVAAGLYAHALADRHVVVDRATAAHPRITPD